VVSPPLTITGAAGIAATHGVCLSVNVHVAVASAGKTKPGFAATVMVQVPFTQPELV
jgi:hypothetical protein